VIQLPHHTSRFALLYNDSIAVNFTSGRVHNLAMTVTPSIYLDNTFLNNPAGVTTLGYRAAFSSYTVAVDQLAMQVYKRVLAPVPFS
jgi:hypothetical protein